MGKQNRHGSIRTPQNDLTLPPIVENGVSGGGGGNGNSQQANNNVNNSKKSNNSSNRVDSGIAVDYPAESKQETKVVGWTLSPSESENGANHVDGRRESITTTFEIVDNNMKKNTTSSTLNSLGKFFRGIEIFYC